MFIRWGRSSQIERAACKGHPSTSAHILTCTAGGHFLETLTFSQGADSHLSRLFFAPQEYTGKS